MEIPLKSLRYFASVLLLLLLLQSACTTRVDETSLPENALEPNPVPLVIDGTIKAGEWSNGDHFELTDGSDLYLLREGEDFYLAVKSSRSGTLGANIFLYQQDRIRILHISAALGTAEYEWDGENWYRVRDFNWKHRTVGNGETALAEREAYQAAEGWSAPNARTGTANHLEMQILIGLESSRIAVSLLRSGSNTKGVWPADLGDDTGAAFSDGLPTCLSLEPENWYLIP